MTEALAKNPYTVLGVSPSASDADIRNAFRKLAKTYHPDRNPGDKRAEEKFKEISAAFDVVGDADRRRKFDRGEIDADGRERGFAGAGHPGGQYGRWPGSEQGGPGGMGGGFGQQEEFSDLGDIFADLFGARSRPKGGARAGGRAGGDGAGLRGRDLRYRLEVDFLEAACGGKKRVTMPDGRALDLTIPPGFEDGQSLRLRGQGEQGLGGGPAGDVYVDVEVRPHDHFDRDGLDIHLEAPISLAEAVLGGKITVPTITGDVALTVPKSASSGAVLRLKGRGVKTSEGRAGDQYVKLRIMLPEGGDAELEEFIRHWSNGDAQYPRKHFVDV